jgi:hypothetical protein
MSDGCRDWNRGERTPRHPEAGARYRHVARGTTYRVVGIGRAQASGNALDDAIVVVYRSEADDRALWVRPYQEFMDGRFQSLPELAR